MDSRKRILKAWEFKEPDRVPIHMHLSPNAEGLPGADKIREFEQNEADNFKAVPCFDWGFLGLDCEYLEETIEEVPGEFKRIRKVYNTPAGKFTAVTRHNADDFDKGDFHWEKRFIDTLEDFMRVAKAKRRARPFKADEYNSACLEVGGGGLPATGLFHPLGSLVRFSNMESMYIWLLTETKIVNEYLENCTGQVCSSLLGLKGKTLASPPVFMTHALEMFTPPWFGREHFMKLVFPYDRKINDAVHAAGGRHRAHCHGKSGDFLEIFADMGIDSLEPLEPPPYGDNSIKQAKKRVGNRMLLSGNIPSQVFYLDSFKPEDVRPLVKKALEEGAPGGGFSLMNTGSGHAGNGKTREQSIKSIECNLALIDAWKEFGKY